MIGQAVASDWSQFYALAAAEGWRVPQVERRMFEGHWSGCARALDVDGVFGGLVTVVVHERSGWIGNLIVPPLLRGNGYGRKLFDAVLAELADRGLSSIWLTASELGRPIYEKSGFKVVGRVERWICPAGRGTRTVVEEDPPACERLRSCDRMAWGESRNALLKHLLADGRVFVCDDSVALLQAGADLQILGPWYARFPSPQAGRRFLLEVLAGADPATEIVTDLLATSPGRQLLAAAGFVCTGSTALMAHGRPDLAAMEMIMSLASLGSVG
jgi:GNAT superfamily N-acetyltransferase